CRECGRVERVDRIPRWSYEANMSVPEPVGIFAVVDAKVLAAVSTIRDAPKAVSTFTEAECPQHGGIEALRGAEVARSNGHMVNLLGRVRHAGHDGMRCASGHSV